MDSRKKGLKITSVVIISSLILLIIIQLIVSNMTAGNGEELAKVENQIQEVARRNNLLREEIAQHTSLTEIAKQQETLGLIQPTSILYLPTLGQQANGAKVGLLNPDSL